MIFGIGTDILRVDRVAAVYERFGARFVERLLMPDEQELFSHSKNPVRFLAMRFAAKEAVMKALGTGLRGFSWADMEISRDSLGKPLVTLTGVAREKAIDQGITEIIISLSFSRGNAIAAAVALNAKD